MSDLPSQGIGGRPETAAEASLSPRDGDSGSARSSLSSSSSPGDSATNATEMKSESESLVLHLPAKLYASQVAQIREEKPKRSATTPTSTRPTQVPPLVFPLTNNFDERPPMPHLPPSNANNGSFFGHNAESNAKLGSPQQYWDPNDASYVPPPFPPLLIITSLHSSMPLVSLLHSIILLGWALSRVRAPAEWCLPHCIFFFSSFNVSLGHSLCVFSRPRPLLLPSPLPGRALVSKKSFAHFLRPSLLSRFVICSASSCTLVHRIGLRLLLMSIFAFFLTR